MNDRVDRVKKHLSENKKVYISAGVGLVVGAAGMYVYGSTTKTKATAAVKINAYKSTVSVTNIAMAFEEHSTPSKRVYCPELKRGFNSINDAARETGKSRQRISHAIAGLRDSVDELTFCLIDGEE